MVSNALLKGPNRLAERLRLRSDALLDPTMRFQLLTHCLHLGAADPCKQKAPRRALFKQLILRRENGAGEGIRTLDPDLGKVVLYP